MAKFKLGKCDCCLLPATVKRVVKLGRPAVTTKMFGACEYHAKVPAAVFRALAGASLTRSRCWSRTV